jgi:hypothetical protein
MSKKKNEQEIAILETFPKPEPVVEVQEQETKATIDGVFVVEACFKMPPVDVLPASRYPTNGEKVLYMNGDVPMYGRPE